MVDRTRVLVTYASKMGSTQEIAEAIGRELEVFGIQVTVAPCADKVSPEDFDGVIIGSAIYTRRWLKAATKYLKRNAPRLERHRTWLFHSGPCGEGARDEQVPAPKAAERVIGRFALSAPVTFGGRLDVEHAVGPLSRWMGAEGPLSGDFRDWDRIRAWAKDIARQLDPATAARSNDAG
jgi:menaquinone-dependent protoporphyrinogen oxidase